MELSGKRVVVVGAGKSGLSAARLLLKKGARVTLEDNRPQEALNLPADLSSGAVTLSLGQPLDGERLRDADVVVVSPGVPLALPGLQEARRRGQTLWGEIELAYRCLSHDVPWVGVTGTNGKSTTTALTGELFRQGGKDPFVGGNLGVALSEAALSGKPYGSFVVELSSFQLESVDEFHLNGAAIMNVTPDHLDRYASPDEYAAAKARIFRHQTSRDAAVVNVDDLMSAKLAPSDRGNAPVYGFTLRPMSRSTVYLSGRASPTEGGFAFDFGGRPRFKVQGPALRGAHNLQNAMAAALLAFHNGVSVEGIQAGLDAFKGLPHRLELVRTLRDVEWINDSKATNVESSVVALRALEGKRVWLIAGGRGKGAPYTPLKEAAVGRVSGVFTIGEDAQALETAMRPEVSVVACGGLERAVAAAARVARAGEVVLLSPACASYDQFKNFEDRGETFRRLVEALP